MDTITYGKLLHLASNTLIRQMNQLAKKYDLTGVQMLVIDFLAHKVNQQAYQQEIENEFSIKRSTTTTMLQRMENKKLIVRVSHDSDKRQKVVKLTPEALKLLPVVTHHIERSEANLISDLTPSEQALIKRFLLNIIERK